LCPSIIFILKRTTLFNSIFYPDLHSFGVRCRIFIQTANLNPDLDEKE
jgi:hypothetical protein